MADTAVSIGCRKTIEVAGRLTAWLDRTDALASEVKPVLGTALERATLDLRRVMRSIDYPPCVGVVGGPDQNKLELVAASLFHDGVTTVNEFSQLRNQHRGFQDILEKVAAGDLGTALRFRSANVRENAKRAEYRFPIQVELLTTLDIVKIVVSAYYTNFPQAVCTKPDQDDIQSVIERADRALSTAVVTGFSPEDVSNLRQYLWWQFPRVEGLRTLSSSGYWDWLAKHVAHLSVEGRVQMLSYLWRLEPNFTELFRRLTEGLSDLGYTTSVRVPVEAIVGADPQTGSLAAHHSSITRQSTIHGLLASSQPTQDFAVSIGQGTVRNASRSVIAALAHTINLQVDRAAPFPLDSTNLKLFPSPSPLADVAVKLADTKRGETESDLIEQYYARGKSIFAFSRSCTRNELSAVVLLADWEQEPDDIHMQSITDWIELSEGADPRARERMENCLAILVKTPDDAREQAVEGLPGGGTFDLGPNGDQEPFVARLLGENNRWSREWTPGRPFSQIHYVAEFSKPAQANRHRFAAVKPSSLANMEDGIFPARAPVAASALPAVNVLLEIAANSSQVIRVRQVRRQLATIQRALQARIFRYHRSSNPAQFTDWRRQIANVATKRLEVCAEAGQLGNMLAVLIMSEPEVRMLLAGLKGGAVDYQELDEYSIDINIGRAALPEPEICAEATVAAWLKLMHEATSSRQLCSQLDIAQPVFQHIVDEIVICAHRLDLVGVLTTKFVRALESGNPLSDLPKCYSVIASRVIGSFLERLAIAGVTSETQDIATGGRPPITASTAGSRPSGPPGRSTSREPTADARFPSAPWRRDMSRWPLLFRRMVDDNIVAAEGLTARSEADHELGEYLSMLTSNPLEVEL